MFDEKTSKIHKQFVEIISENFDSKEHTLLSAGFLSRNAVEVAKKANGPEFLSIWQGIFSMTEEAAADNLATAAWSYRNYR